MCVHVHTNTYTMCIHTQSTVCDKCILWQDLTLRKICACMHTHTLFLSMLNLVKEGPTLQHTHMHTISKVGIVYYKASLFRMASWPRVEGWWRFICLLKVEGFFIFAPHFSQVWFLKAVLLDSPLSMTILSVEMRWILQLNGRDNSQTYL